MKSFIDFIKCCNGGNKINNCESLPTVIKQDIHNKCIEDSTNKSQGSNRNSSSELIEISLSIDINSEKDFKFKNTNEYDNALFFKNTKTIVTNTLPDKSHSINNIHHIEKRLNTIAITNHDKKGILGSKEVANINTSQLIDNNENISNQNNDRSFNNKEQKSNIYYTSVDSNANVPSYYSYFNINNIIILDSEIKSNKKLILEDFSGNLLNGKKLYIDAAGLKDGLRNKRDGFSFFGNVKENSNGEIVNDFILNYSKNNEENSKSCKKYNPELINNTTNSLFVIYYDRTLQKYFYRNMREAIENSLTYIKIEKNCFIDKKKFFLIGQILIYLDPDYIEKTMKVAIFFKDSDVTKKYVFTPEHSPISIGRNKYLTISLENSFLSKHQCTIEYDNVFDIWKIMDGSESGKKSTHGTWLLVDSKYELTNSTFVKISNNVVKIIFY